VIAGTRKGSSASILASHEGAIPKAPNADVTGWNITKGVGTCEVGYGIDRRAEHIVLG
jgi:hypothetical protein